MEDAGRGGFICNVKDAVYAALPYLVVRGHIIEVKAQLPQAYPVYG